MLDCFKYLLQFNSYAEILVKLEEQCSQLFCGKAIHWVICWCQKWRLMGTIFDIVPAIQKVFICLVSSLLMNIFSIVFSLITCNLLLFTSWVKAYHLLYGKDWGPQVIWSFLSFPTVCFYKLLFDLHLRVRNSFPRHPCKDDPQPF